MNRKLIISKLKFNERECLATAVLDTEIDRIIDLSLETKEKERILANIYVGKVQKVAEHINAAFIAIQPNLSCYYSLRKNKTPYITSTPKRPALKAGDEILVQVSTEALKNKIPTVTSQINISGQYVVLTVNKKGLGVSAKLDHADRDRLKTLLLPYLKDTCGIIARTNAATADPEDVKTEVEALFARLEEIYHLGNTRTCYSLIDAAVTGQIRELRSIKADELSEIVTDDEEVFASLETYLQDSQSNSLDKLRYYDDKAWPLAKLYSIESNLEAASNEKVWLQSGGFLMIQQTEAFVVIDVNSGKYQGRRDATETYKRINFEAAKEIAIQLRLRNLSGIIMIDFINMDNLEFRDELLSTLQKYLHEDNVRALVVDITALHIVEITRKKVKKSLAEQMMAIQ